MRRFFAVLLGTGFAPVSRPSPCGASLLALRGAYVDSFVHHITMLAASGDSGAANVELDGVTYYTYPTVNWTFAAGTLHPARALRRA